MARVARVAATADLPSITELGRTLGAITRREAGIDLVTCGRPAPRDEAERLDRVQADRRRGTVDKLLYRQMEALREIIGTLPAQSLSDCAVQVGVASHIVSKLANNRIDSDEVNELADTVERILVSVMPVLAAAAGLDQIEFALNEVSDLHEARFPPLP